MEEAKNNEPINYKGVYELASGLIWRDGKFLLYAYPILIIPYLLEFFTTGFSFYNALLFTLLERFSQLVFLFCVGKRWIAQLSLSKDQIWHSGLVKLLLFGFLIWAGLIIPVLIQLMPLQATERLFLLILLGPVLVFWFRYYFYFFPCILGRYSNREVLSIARTFTIRDSYLPWKTLIGPIAIWSLCEALTSAISPDGRIIEAYYLKCLLAGVFWCLVTYISLAASFIYLPEKIWHESNLDPYREARIATLSLGAPSFISTILSQRNGIKVLIASLILWFANFITLQTMAPSPSINVDSIVIRNDKVELTLTLNDPTYRFRGFQPVNLLLAGEQGAMVSTEASSSVEKETNKSVSVVLPNDKDKITIVTTFKTNRSGENLKALQDLYLWYRSYKVTNLKMNEATIHAVEEVSNPEKPPALQ